MAVVFALIASAVITAQFLLDGLPLDASFLWACAFFSCALVAIAVGYGLGDELRRAWAAGGIGRAWPWLTGKNSMPAPKVKPATVESLAAPIRFDSSRMATKAAMT